MTVDQWLREWRYADHSRRGTLVLDAPDDLDHMTYWQSLSHAWVDSDRQPLKAEHWRSLFKADRPGRENLMTAEEQAKLASLPDRVTVYRGFSGCTPDYRILNGVSGLSWTLDRQCADWFARRFARCGRTIAATVTVGKVRRERAVALFDARGEDEVLVFPRYVYDRKAEWADAHGVPYSETAGLAIAA
ncbi:hypothetical protein [Candidatus Solirubrobacter pratensis]|uniref:hypothetical protein n=1 Tax=Candidatus Solirubrobacter pratensis TaxID=1298857 RepID=UPI0006871C15|nr:hypothetical protein [Candidatus Solirubrobacter pratensis]